MFLLQLCENIVFKLQESVLTTFDLVDKLILGLFEGWLLFLNDNTQALLLETILLDGEVDHIDLGGNFWSIVWISHSSCDVHLEILVIDDFTVSQFDQDLLTDALDERLV